MKNSEMILKRLVLTYTEIFHSNSATGEWVNIACPRSRAGAAFVEEWCRKVNLAGADCEDEEHFQDVHPCLRTSSVLSHFEVDLLSFNLSGDVHRNRIQLVLESFNLTAYLLDGAYGGLALNSGRLLNDQEVDFLRFPIQFLPAYFYFIIWFQFWLETNFASAFFFDSSELFLALFNL